MAWSSIFDEITVESAATVEQVVALASRLEHPLPIPYRDFLLWSNGGRARTGKMEFGFFDTQSVVEYLENYEFPEFMSGAVPFALNGGGVFTSSISAQPSLMASVQFGLAVRGPTLGTMPRWWLIRLFNCVRVRA